MGDIDKCETLYDEEHQNNQRMKIYQNGDSRRVNETTGEEVWLTERLNLAGDNVHNNTIAPDVFRRGKVWRYPCSRIKEVLRWRIKGVKMAESYRARLDFVWQR